MSLFLAAAGRAERPVRNSQSFGGARRERLMEKGELHSGMGWLTRCTIDLCRWQLVTRRVPSVWVACPTAARCVTRENTVVRAYGALRWLSSLPSTRRTLRG